MTAEPLAAPLIQGRKLLWHPSLSPVPLVGARGTKNARAMSPPASSATPVASRPRWCPCGAGPAPALAPSALPATRALGALLDSASLPRSRVLLAHGPDTAARALGPDRCASGKHRRQFVAARKDGAFSACPPGVSGAPRGGRCLCAGRLALPRRPGISGPRIQPRCARMPSRRGGHTRSTGRSDRHLPLDRARGHQRCTRVSAFSRCFDAGRRLLLDSELVDVERAQKPHRGVKRSGPSPPAGPCGVPVAPMDKRTPTGRGLPCDEMDASQAQALRHTLVQAASA